MRGVHISIKYRIKKGKKGLEKIDRVARDIQNDPRNKLNDLSSKRWVEETKSVWYSKPPPRDALKSQHPATFAESDIRRLLVFFTKSGQLVLDPFLGVGSTLIACLDEKRRGVGIELSEKWADIARRRVNLVTEQKSLDEERWGADAVRKCEEARIIRGDSRAVMRTFEKDSFDFIVTSPPYSAILTKAKDHKSKLERITKGLDTQYSRDLDDLGNIPDYSRFLEELKGIWAECHRVLRPEKYMAIIVSDYRDGSKYISFHSDVEKTMTGAGFVQKGIIILVQDDKTLYPYGYPFSFVPNVHHQYILIFRKDTGDAAPPNGGPCEK